VFAKMRGVAYAFSRQIATLNRSRSQADDVVQEVAITVLSLVRAGNARSKSRGSFSLSVRR